MVKVVKPGSRQNIFQSLWELFGSLDRFTKLLIVATLLIVLITPVAITLHATLNQYAAGNPQDIGTAATAINTKTYTGTASPSVVAAVVQNYQVDAEVVSELSLLNAWRVQHGMPALTPSKELTDIAKWMATDMANKSYMSHYDSTCISSSCAITYNNACQTQTTCGRFLVGRFNALWPSSGPSWTLAGENLAEASYNAPAVTAVGVMTAWENSPEHESNMVGVWNSVGIYRMQNPATGWVYWAEEFGDPLVTPVSYSTVALTPTPTSTPINCMTQTRPCSGNPLQHCGSCTSNSQCTASFCAGTTQEVGGCQNGCCAIVNSIVNSSVCTAPAPSNPCTVKQSNGLYLKGGACGGSTLYQCSGTGYATSSQVCTYGCQVNSGTVDTCKSAPAPTPTPASVFVAPKIGTVSCTGGTAKLNFSWVTQGTGATVEVYYCDLSLGTCSYKEAPAPYYAYPNQGPILTGLITNHNYAWFVEAQCSIGSGMSSVGNFTCH